MSRSWRTFRRPAISLPAITVVCLCLSIITQPVANAVGAPSSVPKPKISGPIAPKSGVSFIGSTLFALSGVGYEESEYFLSGTATAYKSATRLTKNGAWHVRPATTAPYKTRIVVYRPINPKHFDGTVVVEWLNVTAGIDAPAAWLSAHVQMIRSGMAYVGVDAQAGGINGEPNSIAAEDAFDGLKPSDPKRYGSLHHPGDSFSYSIYEQAGEAIHASGARLLGGLRPKRVMALGESQSAFRLVTYIDAIQPLSPGIYNAYFVYSRGGDGADLSQAPERTIAAPTPTFIRTDLHVPVFIFETESDLLGLGYLSARQPPTRYIREWETAGTAHDDTYGLLYARSDAGNGTADVQAFQSILDPPSDPIPGIIDCAAPINAGSHTYELRAALVAVNKWMGTGMPPRQSPRLNVSKNRTSFVTNDYGEALGGIRTPQVEAPVARLSGLGQPGAPSPPSHPGKGTQSVTGAALCAIFGTTVPFSAAHLTALYPTHADFVARWDAATAAELDKGYLLPADARTLDRVALQSNVGG
ncbi:MAG TPA: alpha/beta hydrolase domain-containing protein [Acidimicrobiales bacterium]|nr:alpha/beta hydrolase domain-containing protein [Acidimicrobiales bacterium]